MLGVWDLYDRHSHVGAHHEGEQEMRGGGERDCVLAAAGRREGWQVGKDPKMQASLYLFPPPGGDALHPVQANQWQAGKSEPVKG